MVHRVKYGAPRTMSFNNQDLMIYLKPSTLWSTLKSSFVLPKLEITRLALALPSASCAAFIASPDSLEGHFEGGV